MNKPEIQNLAAERAVLGSILLAPDTVGVALEVLTIDDFADVRHRLVFDAIASLARESKPLTMVTLTTCLRASQTLERVGGAVLGGLTSEIATGANLAHYTGIVRSTSRLRRLAETARQIAAGAVEAADAEMYIAESQGRLLAMTEDTRGDIVTAKEWTVRAYKRLERMSESGESPALDTGLQGIDRMRILRPGSLVTLAGRPGMGKTSLAQNLALGAAAHGAHTLFVSIEMGEEEIENKFVGAKSGVPTRTLEWPKFLKEEDWPRLAKAFADMSGQGIDLWVASSVHIDELRIRARRVHATRPLDLIVVDYMQLMRGERGDGRVQEVSSISRGLKILAKETGATVLALSQLNRDCEKRSPPIPMLSDLRESGAIEQDSDAVMFVYRPWVYDENANQNEASAIVAKNRHGAPGEAKLHFDPAIQRFTDMEDRR